MDPHDRAAARLAWTRATLHDDSLTLASASADASFRSYWRTQHQGRSWIVMDSPPALEDPRPWLALGATLAAAGLHVPHVRAHDLPQGFLLIEDLGQRLYLDELREDNADALYGAAMDALLRMQERVDTSTLPRFDRALLMQGLQIMPTWFLERHLGRAPDHAERATLDAAFELIARNHDEQPHGFVHRDFHSRNLLVIERHDDEIIAPGTIDPALASPGIIAPGLRSPGIIAPGLLSPGIIAPGLLSPGIIDFQGALHGPLTYDLASLLRDAYIVWPSARVDAWVETYRQHLLAAGSIDSGVDRARFLRWFDLTGLQRHLRVLGQFYRLWYRDGKPGYLADVPRVYDYVIGVANRYPELAELAALLQRRVGDRDLRVVSGA
jgi:aminoglycoside/choline kinase family phosphotransferase